MPCHGSLASRPQMHRCRSGQRRNSASPHEKRHPGTNMFGRLMVATLAGDRVRDGLPSIRAGLRWRCCHFAQRFRWRSHRQTRMTIRGPIHLSNRSARRWPFLPNAWLGTPLSERICFDCGESQLRPLGRYDPRREVRLERVRRHQRSQIEYDASGRASARGC